MPAPTPPTHYYRIEISGGHTGSAYRYHSWIYGTLKEAERALEEELGNSQGLSFLVCEGARFSLESYEDGARRGQHSAYPAVKIKLPRGRLLEFTAGGGLVGIDVEDPEELLEHPEIGPLLEGDADVEPVIDLALLPLPPPNGKPLRRGQEATYERGGKSMTQPYGMAGSWNEPLEVPPPLRAKPAGKSKVTSKSTGKATVTGKAKVTGTGKAKVTGTGKTKVTGTGKTGAPPRR